MEKKIYATDGYIILIYTRFSSINKLNTKTTARLQLEKKEGVYFLKY